MPKRTRKEIRREQKLINICFEIGMRLRMGDAKFQDNEKCGEWIAQQLRDHGFDTKPCGLSWGTLVDENGEFIT